MNEQRRRQEASCTAATCGAQARSQQHVAGQDPARQLDVRRSVQAGVSRQQRMLIKLPGHDRLHEKDDRKEHEHGQQPAIVMQRGSGRGRGRRLRAVTCHRESLGLQKTKKAARRVASAARKSM